MWHAGVIQPSPALPMDRTWVYLQAFFNLSVIPAEQIVLQAAAMSLMRSKSYPVSDYPMHMAITQTIRRQARNTPLSYPLPPLSRQVIALLVHCIRTHQP